MTETVVDQQVLRGATGTLRFQHRDGDGEPADPGATTVGITRSDGTVVVAPGQATTGTGTNPRAYSLGPFGTSLLDVLAVTWTYPGGSAITLVEIVGGYYFDVATMRDSDQALRDDTKYPAPTLLKVRGEVQDEIEEICDTAFVPRFRRQPLDGSGGCNLLLPTPYPRAVRAVGELAADGTSTAWAAGDVAALRVEESGLIHSPGRGFPCGTRNVVVSWEHGLDRPTADLREKALLLLRHRATRPRTAVPDRATSFQIEGGNVYRLDTPGRDRTGIPEVDAALGRWSMAIPGIA